MILYSMNLSLQVLRKRELIEEVMLREVHNEIENELMLHNNRLWEEMVRSSTVVEPESPSSMDEEEVIPTTTLSPTVLKERKQTSNTKTSTKENIPKQQPPTKKTIPEVNTVPRLIFFRSQTYIILFQNWSLS